MTPPAIPTTPGEGTVNAPHENDEDPAAFFGDGDGETDEHSLLPDGETPTDETEPDETVDHSDAPEPSIGEATAGQQFSEDGESVAVIGDAGGEQPAVDPSKPAEDPEQAEEQRKWQEQQDAADAVEVAAQEAAAQEAEKPAASGDAGKPPAADAAAQKNGPRGYVVVREMEMTEDYLKVFAKQLEEGKPPHKFYMVLESKVEARNPAPVLTGAFKKHHKRLGQPLRLAAIPLSMWKIRTLSIKPKVIDENIAIED